MDMPELLQQQKSNPRSGEELEVMGKRAANLWAEGRFNNLSDSVVDVVKEAGLSAEQVKRVVEFTNVNAFLEEFRKEGTASKYVDFGDGKLADTSRVLHDLNDGGDPGEEVDVQTNAYNEQPLRVKQASLEDADWVQFFGDPSKEEDYPMAEPHAEYWAVREKLAGMLEHMTTQLSGLETAYGDVSRNLYGHTKRACRDGVPLGDIIRAWSSVEPDPTFIKCAFELISPTLVKDEVFRCFDDVGESITKMSSSRVVNPEHPLVTSYQEYCEILDKLAEVREQRDGLAERLAFLEYQFEKSANAIGKTVRVLGAAGKHTGAIGEAIGGKTLGGVAKYLPHAAATAGGVALASEGKNQIEDSPTANLLLSGIPGTRQAAIRRTIRQQRKMMEAQSNPLARFGVQYMGGGY
jgi:hypothetical protein